MDLKGCAVWAEKGKYTYKARFNETKTGEEGPGWYTQNQTHMPSGEAPPVQFKSGDLLLTENGSVIRTGRPSYVPGRIGAERIEFWIKQSAGWRGYEEEGYIMYYDSSLKHRPGGYHDDDANPGLDIVGLFKEKLEKRCPHCGKCV